MDVVIYINSGLAALAVMKLTRNCVFFVITSLESTRRASSSGGRGRRKVAKNVHDNFFAEGRSLSARPWGPINRVLSA